MAKKDLGITLLSDRVLILQEQKQSGSDFKTVTGIILPSKEKETGLAKGAVAAVGTGRRKENGDLIPMSVKVGDVVFFKKGYDAEELELGGVEYILGGEGNIYAIISA